MMINKRKSNQTNVFRYVFVLSLLSGILFTTHLQGETNLTAKVAQTPEANDSTIKFDTTTHNFGVVKESDKTVETVFTFTNMGKTPLVITNVSASCGCTSPEFTKEPVPPNGKGIIKVTFNAVGRIGPFDKSITVNSNGIPGIVTLRIKGSVVKQ